MIRAGKKQNIVFQYVFWHFFEVPKEILQAWKNYLLYNLNYFSIPLLIATFFSPWRKYQWSYGRGFDFGRYLETFLSNLISRVLGAIIRLFLIFFGLTLEALIFFVGLIIFLAWILLPVFMVTGLLFGLKIIF